MLEKIEGIVIDVIRHSDRHNIVTLYTRSRGRVAFLSPVGSGKSGRMRNATLQPLACVSCEVNFKPNRELQILPAVTASRVRHNLYFNPVKSSLVLFLTEFLNSVLRFAMPDPAMWDYICASIDLLDSLSSSKAANFHITFLYNLLSYLGLSPRIDGYREGMVFDMTTAEFLFPGFLKSNAMLDADEAAFIPLLDRITFANMHLFRLSSAQRHRLLDLIIRFYAIHLSLRLELKSLEVLKELFS